MRSFRITFMALSVLFIPIVAPAVDVRTDSLPPIRPDCDLIDKAAAIVRARVGEEFYSKRLQFRSLNLDDLRGVQVVRMIAVGSESKAQYEARPEVYYRVYYDIRWGDKPPDGVEFDMDASGRLLTDPSTLRLPPCAEHPEDCIFAVTRDTARAVAMKANNAVDYSDFTDFLWSNGFRRYVWAVQLWPPGANRNAGGAPPEGARLAIVDANSGEVLRAGPWTRYGQQAE